MGKSKLGLLLRKNYTLWCAEKGKECCTILFPFFVSWLCVALPVESFVAVPFLLFVDVSFSHTHGVLENTLPCLFCLFPLFYPNADAVLAHVLVYSALGFNLHLKRQ